MVEKRRPKEGLNSELWLVKFIWNKRTTFEKKCSAGEHWPLVYEFFFLPLDHKNTGEKCHDFDNELMDTGKTTDRNYRSERTDGQIKTG